MAEEIDIILLNYKLMHSGNLSELQFSMLGPFPRANDANTNA